MSQIKNIVFITDVWDRIDGVVTWLSNIKEQLEKRGVKVTIIHSGEFFHVPLPTYPDIKLAFFAGRKLAKIIKEINPDQIHIATEGPLGLSAVRVCKKNHWKFTTFYHTRLPEYVQVRLKFFKSTVYRYMKWFHNSGTSTFVGSKSLLAELKDRGFKNLIFVPHGINPSFFSRNPSPKKPREFGGREIKKPIFVFMGRLAPEKNIEAFLDLDLPGSKLIIGDGPSKVGLQKKYGDAHFVGFKKGQELVDLLCASDVYIFPSKTDTFGLTLVEALACGLPVAAYPVTGPIDVVESGKDGYLGLDLAECALKCLEINRANCIKKARQYSWSRAADEFLKNLAG